MPARLVITAAIYASIYALWLAGAPFVTADAAELKPEAAQGFDRYIQRAELRMQKEEPHEKTFLWLNRLPESRRGDVLARLRRGEVVTVRFASPEGAEGAQTEEAPLPGALIHHWIGTVFIPRASLPEVLALVQDYDNHQNYYAPQAVRSKTLARAGGSFKVYFRLMRKKIVTVVLDTEYDVAYEQIDPMRAQSRSYSTRIAEVESSRKSDERQLPPGNDHGFLWRLDSFWRFQQADGGVYVQCEAISLTRDIPAGLNWLIAPFVESVPQESLEFTLQATRIAVQRQLRHVSTQAR